MFCIGMDKTNSSTLQRPRNPPPPAPSSVSTSRLSNGRSSESLSSMCSDHGLGNPVPPPRKVSFTYFKSKGVSMVNDQNCSVIIIR